MKHKIIFLKRWPFIRWNPHTPNSASQLYAENEKLLQVYDQLAEEVNQHEAASESEARKCTRKESNVKEFSGGNE